MMDGMRGLDVWITGGRFSSEPLLITCPDCEEKTAVNATTEYGSTEWSKYACDHCGREFEGDEETELDEPPESPDRWDDGPDDRDTW